MQGHRLDDFLGLALRLLMSKMLESRPSGRPLLPLFESLVKAESKFNGAEMVEQSKKTLEKERAENGKKAQRGAE